MDCHQRPTTGIFTKYEKIYVRVVNARWYPAFMTLRFRIHSLLLVLVTGCAANDVEPSPELDHLTDALESPDQPECPAGLEQSPIDLPWFARWRDLPNLRMDYGETHVSIKNTGHAIQYNYDPGSFLRVSGQQYELLQMHFHAHSEHTIGGRHTPLELHLVHLGPEGQLLVVAVLIEEGWHNPTFDDADLDELPATAGQVFENYDHHFNAEELLPRGPTYRYNGSLTAQPCTGDVSWIVYRRSITMDRWQIRSLTRLYGHNYRDVQPRDGRTIAYGE